jgi:hypothetical protein
MRRRRYGIKRHNRNEKGWEKWIQEERRKGGDRGTEG